MNDSITVDTARLPLLLQELRLPTIAAMWVSVGRRPRVWQCRSGLAAATSSSARVGVGRCG